jgi:hypothetical protein
LSTESLLQPSHDEADGTERDELNSFDLRIFDPKSIRLFRVAGVTRMTAENDRSWRKVSVVRAFPISDPGHYVGFLDGLGKDIGMIYDPALLDEESRRIVAEELHRRYFVPVVRQVVTMKEEFGTVYWTVDTDKGRKELIARNLRDNLHELSATRVLITDVEGNRFEFPDINALDGKSLGVILRNL